MSAVWIRRIRSCCHCKHNASERKLHSIILIYCGHDQLCVAQRAFCIPIVAVSACFGRYDWYVLIHLCVVREQNGVLVIIVRFAEAVIGIGNLWHGELRQCWPLLRWMWQCA